MEGIIGFKTQRQQKEFLNDRLNKKVKGVSIALANISYYVFDIPLIITHIFRKQKEQDSYYRSNPNYIEKPWKSVHQYFRGIDIRTIHYTSYQIETLLNVANAIIYDEKRPEKKTAIFHDIGQGNHLHLQSLG